MIRTGLLEKIMIKFGCVICLIFAYLVIWILDFFFLIRNLCSNKYAKLLRNFYFWGNFVDDFEETAKQVVLGTRYYFVAY